MDDLHVIPVSLMLDDREYALSIDRSYLLQLQDEAGHPGDPDLLPDGIPPGAIAVEVVCGPPEPFRALAEFTVALRHLNSLPVQQAIARSEGLIIIGHLVTKDDQADGVHYAMVPYNTPLEYQQQLPIMRGKRPEMVEMIEGSARKRGTGIHAQRFNLRRRPAPQ